MSQEAIKAITPVGRIVWGSVYDRQTEDYDGNKYNPGEGPFQFGLAILKTDPNVGNLLMAIYNQAKAGYQNNPQIGQRIDNEWQSGFTMGLFRFKVKDGDQPNSKGVVNPNAKGHWVFAFQTTLPLKCGNTMNAEIDPKTVKTGYFVDIAMTCKINDKVDGTAGVYLNPQVVRLIAFGDEITGGPSVEEAFAGYAAPTNLPPGASLTPKAPASDPGTVGGGLPGQGGPGMAGNPTGTPHQQTQQNGLPGPGGQNSGGISTMTSPSNVGAPGTLPGGPVNPNNGQPVQPHQLPGLPGQR